MQSFKFEIWPVKDFDGMISGFVVTRPVENGEEDTEGQPITRNYSKIRENMHLAITEIRVALDNLDKAYKASESQTKH